MGLDDGKIYITHDGSYFKTRCGYQNKVADKTITTVKAISQAECTEFCGITAGCKRYVDFLYFDTFQSTGLRN